ncbi:hypothetical protein ACGFIG_09290 [Micromonospora sp. NPDC049048]|uniref:hypothetical protein n=1 Tax=Micromonospora sp. NPDC049048 TaxID=3364263 RepID=UPI0037176AF3
MPDLIQFVDSISSSPTVRLDLNDDVTWSAPYDGSDFSPPELRRAESQSLLYDGGQVPAAAYANRIIRLRLELVDANVNAVATRMYELVRELDRPRNLLRWQPGTAAPVFFRTLRSEIVRDTPMPGGGMLRIVDVEILAEPFAVGLEESIGRALNADTSFESGSVGGWTGQNAAVAVSSTFARTGTYSLRVTPVGGVSPAAPRSEAIPVVAGAAYVATSWMYSPTGWAAGASTTIDWSDAGGSLLSSSLGSVVAVPAGVWTQYQTVAVAPAGAVSARLRARMAGTPASTDVLYVDDVSIAHHLVVSNDPASATNGLCMDVTGIKGDMPTPLHLVVASGVAGAGRRRSGLAVRRRGTPSAVPLVLQAEAMTQGTDTTTQANSAVMSGSGNNFSRITFSTQPGLTQRLSTAKFPAAASVDARGTYRVFARVRQNTAGDSIDVRLRWGGADALISNSNVRLPQNTLIHYVDLGLIQVPSGYDPTTRGPSGVELATEGVSLAVDARRVLGAGTLDVDVLLLWPADDRASYVLWPETATGVTDFWLEGGPAPQAYARNSSGQVMSTQAIEIAGGGLMVSPGVTNRVFFARDLGTSATGGDDVTATTVLSGSYWPLYLRPATS